MKPLILPNNNPSEPPKISIQDAERMAQIAADRAATQAAERAAEQVSREAMNSFEKFQQNQSQERNSNQNQNPDEILYEGDGGYSIDTKTEKNLMRRLLDQTLQKALDPPPPSPIENAVTTVMNQVSAGIAQKMLGSLGGGTEVVKKSSFLIELLNTQLAANFGAAVGNRLPESIQALGSTIGQKKAQELVDIVNSKIGVSQDQNNSNNSNVNNPSDVEKQKDMVLALDVNNPENVKQYAHAMGLSEKAAKGMLQIHQDDIRSERKLISKGSVNQGIVNQESVNQGNVGQENIVNQNRVINNDITQALTILIQKMSGMEETINVLNNKIIDIEGKRISDKNVSTSVQPIAQQSLQSETDSKWDDDELVKPQLPVNVTTKSVTLFQTPIKVDVDSIQGNSDPFFTDSKQNTNANVKENSINKKEKVKKESVLEEIVDDEGKSTFKMSDEEKENPKEKTKEQPKNIIQRSEKVTEKEEDKKKDNPDELINENDIVLENIEPKIEETKVEETKVERKRIVRKPIPIKETQESLSSIEHYDINNNLIT